MIHSQNTGLRRKEGDIAENAWLQRYPDSVSTDVATDRLTHIDFYLDGTSYDIKNARMGVNMLTIEFLNTLGQKGSLYGKQDKIAYYIESTGVFHVVDRAELQQWAELSCSSKEWVARFSDARGKLWRNPKRKAYFKELGRMAPVQDAVTLITLNELQQFESYSEM